MTSSFSHILKPLRLSALLIAGMLCLCAVHPAAAGNACRIIVVRSAQLQPHIEVVRGLKEASECIVREVTLRDDEGPGKITALQPDVVVSVGTSGLKKLKDVRTVPIIYAMAIPSEALRYEAPNISGVSMDLSPTVYLGAMRMIYPEKKRVGVLYDPRNTGGFLEKALKAAPEAGLELVPLAIDDPSRVPAALTSLQGRIDIFWMLPDPTMITAENLDLLFGFSFQSRIPIFTFSKKYLEMGAVASVDLDPYDIGLQVAELAKKLTSGPGPVRQYARTPRISVNKSVARKMGFPIKDNVMTKVKNID